MTKQEFIKDYQSDFSKVTETVKLQSELEWNYYKLQNGLATEGTEQEIKRLRSELYNSNSSNYAVESDREQEQRALLGTNLAY